MMATPTIKYFIFSKEPPGGWIAATQPAILEAPGYVYSYAQLAANDDYFFTTGNDYTSVVGFRSRQADGLQVPHVS